MILLFLQTTQNRTAGLDRTHFGGDYTLTRFFSILVWYGGTGMIYRGTQFSKPGASRMQRPYSLLKTMFYLVTLIVTLRILCCVFFYRQYIHKPTQTNKLPSINPATSFHQPTHTSTVRYGTHGMSGKPVSSMMPMKAVCTIHTEHHHLRFLVFSLERLIRPLFAWVR